MILSCAELWGMELSWTVWFNVLPPLFIVPFLCVTVYLVFCCGGTSFFLISYIGTTVLLQVKPGSLNKSDFKGPVSCGGSISSAL